MCNFFDPDEGRDHRDDGNIVRALGVIAGLWLLAAATVVILSWRIDIGTLIMEALGWKN